MRMKSRLWIQYHCRFGKLRCWCKLFSPWILPHQYVLGKCSSFFYRNISLYGKVSNTFPFLFFIFLFMLTNFSLFENPKRKFQSYLVPWVAILRSTNYKSRPHFDYFWCQTFLLTSFLFTSICKNIHVFVARGILYKGEPPPQK